MQYPVNPMKILTGMIMNCQNASAYPVWYFISTSPTSVIMLMALVMSPTEITYRPATRPAARKSTTPCTYLRE